jgi:hypothetical protein
MNEDSYIWKAFIAFFIFVVIVTAVQFLIIMRWIDASFISKAAIF